MRRLNLHHRRPGLWLWSFLLLGCDSLFHDNPINCVRNSSACAPDMFCNVTTQLCETLDCTVNPALCSQGQHCDTATRRCATTTCVDDATLCTATQECSPLTQTCQTRTFVLGQRDPITNANAAYGMNAPLASVLAPDPLNPGKTKLLVGESANYRVLIWNDVPTQSSSPDAVVGMPDLSTLSGNGVYGGVNEGSVSSPWGIGSDGIRLVVSDSALHRVLIWDPIPTQPGTGGLIPANRVWGQNSFETSAANLGQTAPNALTVFSPRAFVERNLSPNMFLADSNNHRVLMFSGIPSSPQTAPSLVLGQTLFNTNTPGSGASGLNTPQGVCSDGTQVFVADRANHRVLGYRLSGLSSGGAASMVLGQADFTSITANRGSATPNNNTLSIPIAVGLVPGGAGTLFVADQGNNRVLRFTLPGTQADLVLGQPDFSSNRPNRGASTPSADSMSRPYDVSSDGTRLAVADNLNHRVLIWNQLPTQNGQPADVILGQPGATSQVINNPPAASGLQFHTPSSVASDGTRLAVADTMRHRVLLWNQLPRSGAAAPDVVLGHLDFAGGQANDGMAAPTAATLSSPGGVTMENGALAVTDTGNARILIWQQFPTQNMAAADYVLGQADFTSGTARPAATGLNQPAGVALAMGRLYVADTGYNRVLVFNNPLQNGAAANLVLGQSTLTTGTPNNGGLSARSLTSPTAVFIQGSKLLVADRGNHRVLIWNNLPTANAQLADVVVGQADFGSTSTRATRTRVASPSGLLVHQGRLYVSSYIHSRIMYWNQLPTTNGQRADGVIGQDDFLTTFPNNPDLTPLEKLSSPSGLTATGDQLFIADTLNHRVVVRGIPQ